MNPLKALPFQLLALSCFVLFFSLGSPHVSFASKQVLINGAGASFPYPIYSKWIYEFKKVNPETIINYQSIGSGGGIRQLLNQTVDFGASDAPMLDEEMHKSKKPILHIPTVLGAVVLSYNIPGVVNGLRLDAQTLGDLFMGTIKNWSDPALQKLNPKLKLPNLPIIIAHRSDGSGTTAVFTDYLEKVNPTWKEKVGAGKTVSWPTGFGGKGNEGVAGLIKQTPGALGYIELSYANQNKLAVVHLKNDKGEYIAPTIDSVSKAAADVKDIPEDFRVSITNSKAKGAYPIAAFTYLLLYKQIGKEKGEKIISFVKWAMNNGQKYASELDYAPLPKKLVQKVLVKLKTIELKE